MAIPILIRWAQNNITNNYYGDLLKELGYKSRCSFIGQILGGIHEVLNALSQKPEFKKSHIRIPSLNVLCKNKAIGLPSDGFVVVSAEYNSLSLEMKRIVVDGYISETVNFEYWDEVLRALELKPSVVYSKTDEDNIRKGGHSRYTESEFHKRLKKHIAQNLLRSQMLFQPRMRLFSFLVIDLMYTLNLKTKLELQLKLSPGYPQMMISYEVFINVSNIRQFLTQKTAFMEIHSRTEQS